MLDLAAATRPAAGGGSFASESPRMAGNLRTRVDGETRRKSWFDRPEPKGVRIARVGGARRGLAAGDLVRFAVGGSCRLGAPRCTSGCLVPVGGCRRPIRVAPAQVRRDEGGRTSAQASPRYRACSLPAVRPGPLVRAGDFGSPGQTSKPTRESSTPARYRAQDSDLGFRRVSLDAEVAVIGAGPYGLACTRFLKKAGVDVLTFGEKMRFWQTRMPEQMILRSRRRSSHIADPDGSLSLDAFAAEHGHPRLDPVPLSEFERYGAWYGERAVPDLDGRQIAALVPRGERSFTLRLEDGAEPTVSRVIVAAGISPFAWRDSPLAKLSEELVSHSSYHRTFGRFRGRSVVVVGCGQSALESAALLHEEGAAVELIARRPSPVWLAGDADSLRARVRARMMPPTDVGGRVSGWLAAAPGVLRASPSAVREWTTA